MKLKLFFSLSLAIVLFSCKTTDFENLGSESEPEDKDVYSNLEEEEKANYDEMQDFLIQERIKEIDIPKTVVYVEKPVYYPAGSSAQSDRPELKGTAAARKSTEEATQKIEKWNGGTMYYDYDSDFTYEIYCQPYRITDLILQPGEQVIEMPFLSEEKVWEIGAGVSRSNSTDTQHFFLKPAYSGLTTSFIIITDRRVYHILLKSFKDCYMTQVRWNYPNTMPFNIKSDAMQVNKLKEETVGVNPAFLSFDYKMSYSAFKKPYWLPERIYDDGKHTYIVMNETVLHMTTPVLFNNRNERINYSVSRNLIIINELVEKMTMRVGRQKVTVKKKYYKEPEPVTSGDAVTDIELEDTNMELPPPDKTNSFSSSLNSKLKKEVELKNEDINLEWNTDKLEK